VAKCPANGLTNLLASVCEYQTYSTVPSCSTEIRPSLASMIWLWRLVTRGMNDAIQRTVINRTLEINRLEKLKGLIAKFEAAIQAHDAKVAAAQAALEERERFASLECMHESFASPCLTEMTSSGATEGNTEGSCTITISHTLRKELSHHQENHSTTVLAAARSINQRTGRPPSEFVRCLLTEFRLFSFENGRQYLQAGTLDHIKLATVIKAFEELHPDSQPSLKSTTTRDDWKRAVRENNIDMIAMARSVAEVKTVRTVEEKLKLRPGTTGYEILDRLVHSMDEFRSRSGQDSKL
jgi:hypothetical protein